MSDEKVIDGTTGQVVEKELKYVDVAVFDASDYALSMDKTQRNLNILRQYVNQNFSEGVDFGAPFPGSPKNSLLLPGAEKFNLLFNVYPRFIQIERITDPKTGFCLYHLGCELVNKDTGKIVGYGEGSCNVYESKFRYRNGERVCPNCGKETIKRSKFPPKENPDDDPGWYCYAKLGGCGANFSANDPKIVDQQVGKVENDNFFDLWNNILKYAEKRAMVCAVVYTGGVSELFTQDGDDYEENESAKPKKVVPSKPAQPAKPKVSDSKTVENPKTVADSKATSGGAETTKSPDTKETKDDGLITIWNGSKKKPTDPVTIPAINDINLKFVGANKKIEPKHLKNHLRSHFNVDNLNELTWEKADALVRHLKDEKDSDPRWYKPEKEDAAIEAAKKLGAKVSPVLTADSIMERARSLGCDTMNELVQACKVKDGGEVGVFGGKNGVEELDEHGLELLSMVLDTIEKGGVGANDKIAQKELVEL